MLIRELRVKGKALQTVEDLQIRQHVQDVPAVGGAVTEGVTEVPQRVMEAQLIQFVQGGQAAQAVYTNNEVFPQINVNKEELFYKNVINEKLSYKSISL